MAGELIAMQLKKQFTFLRVLCLTVACGSPAIAGPLLPCLKAVSSNNRPAANRGQKAIARLTVAAL